MTVLDHRHQAAAVPGWMPGATAPRTDPAPLLPDDSPFRVLGTPALEKTDPALLRELYRRIEGLFSGGSMFGAVLDLGR